MEKNKQIELAASLLGWTAEQAAERCIEKPEINCLYFFENTKGGASLLVDTEGNVLYADSSVSPDEHAQAFINGIRTPIELFSKKTKTDQ